MSENRSFFKNPQAQEKSTTSETTGENASSEAVKHKQEKTKLLYIIIWSLDIPSRRQMVLN